MWTIILLFTKRKKKLVLLSLSWFDMLHWDIKKKKMVCLFDFYLSVVEISYKWFINNFINFT